jgi:LysM repeat protein
MPNPNAAKLLFIQKFTLWWFQFSGFGIALAKCAWGKTEQQKYYHSALMSCEDEKIIRRCEMKKLFLTFVFATGIFVLWSQSEIVWSNRLFLDEPQVHKIQKGEYLSKLAKQYYGDPQRWRELALVNRAPNPDHVEIGEEILVPAMNKVTEIGRAKTLTQVNTLVQDQEQLAVRGPSVPMTDASPVVEPSSLPASEITGNGATEPSYSEPVLNEPVTPVEEPGFPWLWLGIGAAVIALVVGFIVFRRQSAEQNVEVEVKDEKNSGIEDFRPRRQYGEASAAKA